MGLFNFFKKPKQEIAQGYYKSGKNIRTYLRSSFQVNSKQFSAKQGAFRISGWLPEKEKQRSVAKNCAEKNK